MHFSVPMLIFGPPDCAQSWHRKYSCFKLLEIYHTIKLHPLDLLVLSSPKCSIRREFILVLLPVPYINHTVFSYSVQAIHKALLEIDEAGTEAAGATAIILTRLSSASRTIKFNRPFLILISDKQTGTTLFMGKIVDPTKE